MADYPTTPQPASTPASFDVSSDPTADAARPNAAHIAHLLAALDAIPRSELPDGPARADLRNAILTGYVDNLYRPLGADYHNIAWAHREPWEDPRQRVSNWAEQWWGGDEDA